MTLPFANTKFLIVFHILFFLRLQTEQEPANTLDVTVTEETPLSPKQSLDNAFTIKDLSSLVNNLEAEITLNEQHLKDENDKRYRFNVSDWLRIIAEFSSWLFSCP